MKLLLVHRYIRPDTPGYAHMLYIMGREFAAAGHDVTIFSAQPSYNDAYDGPPLPRREQVDGMTVIRTPLLRESKRNAIRRSLNFLLFTVSLWIHAVIRIRRYDLMTVTTFPPTLMGFVARTIGLFRRTRYIYHCMDLYPEIALTSGILKRPWLAKLAAAVDRRNCARAAAVVVLSQDMLQTVAARGVNTDNVQVINNFIIDELGDLGDVKAAAARIASDVPAELKNEPQKFRVLFAGNLGRFQSLESIIAAGKLLADEAEIEFLLVGSGVMKNDLQQQAGELLGKTVRFHPYLPIDKVMSVIAESHLGVVSLSPNVIHSAYPSKTMSYLEAGCKLLCIVEPESELARMATSQELGVVCNPPTAESIADAIRSEFRRWQTNGYDRSTIQTKGRRMFGQDVILAKWMALLQRIALQD